ncbi:MAG TPA: membrane protein insertase YidC [Saprospiraceae bacterium]|nr:membrane protein insertase YidC [Saprospiraceae bacterium]
MDRNTVIGFVLLAILFTAWMQLNNSNRQKALEEQSHKDSLSVKQITSTADTAHLATIASADSTSGITDSLTQPVQELKEEILENDLMKVTFTNKGGKIKEIFLKKYLKSAEDDKGKEVRSPLFLMNDPTNQFSYQLPLNQGTTLSTDKLSTELSKSGNQIKFRTDLGQGKILEQSYQFGKKEYTMDYSSKLIGGALSEPISLTWKNTLGKLEKNDKYEHTYSTLYYKSPKENPDYASYSKDASINIEPTQKVQWVSSLNQFFNTTLIPAEPFESAKMTVTQGKPEEKYLKRFETSLVLPQGFSKGAPFSMTIYSGPNDFEGLRAFNNDMEDLVQFGSSIMGTINRWVIRPIFKFLGTFIGNPGLIIFLLTLIVKLALFPLTYKMIHSQSKMSALKPQLEKLKEKNGGDQQKMQMESMAMYREFGVNPLGGCLPMVLQMPIWFALYRFFPASIEFRQAPFWWATDLSSYDAFLTFPFNVPLLGHHLSLFTVLWTVTTLLYTWYNFKNVDTTSTMNNPMMKYMQYVMPVMFMFFFNSFASGLTVYLVFSNIINIAQTILTKSYLINHDKIEKQLHAFKAKPKKKKSGFQERLNTMMQEQQRLAEAKKKSGK